MFSTTERILDVPNEFQIGNVNVSLNAQSEALGQYALDTVFWLGAIWIVTSALRRGATSLISTQISRMD